jgi:uncharacterized protein YcbX
MIVKSEGQFITGRTYPKVVLISPKIEKETMTLSAPGMMDIDVDFERFRSLETNQTTVWGDSVDTIDCGEEVAKWLSRYVLSEDLGLRLVFFPSATATRDVRKKSKIFNKMRQEDSVSL